MAQVPTAAQSPPLQSMSLNSPPITSPTTAATSNSSHNKPVDPLQRQSWCPNEHAADVVSLLLWHDPLTSLLALFCGVLVVVLCEVSGYTMLTLLSYLAALQLITTFVYINGTRLILAIRGVATTAPSTSGMSAPVSAASELEYMYVSQALVLEWSGDVADSINYALNNLAYVLRCRDNAWTIQVIVMFIIAAFVGRIVNGVVLIGLMYVGLFTIPILYVTNQVVCDAYIGQARYVITQWQTILERHLPGFPIKDHTKND